MQAMHLLLAAVTTLTQGRAPTAPRSPEHPRAARVLTESLDGLQGLAELSGLEGLQGLAELQGLEGLQGLETLQSLAGLQGLEQLAGFGQVQGFERLQGFEVPGVGAVHVRRPPVAWDVQDPGDSLYRAARRAFNRNEYTTAAELYYQLIRRYPRSAYAGDAYYWAAFALFRTGDGSSLKQARTLLDTQERGYAQASTRRDAPQLYARIQTALAQQGDQAADIWVRDHAATPRAPPAPRAPTAVAAPTAPTAPRVGPTCAASEDEDDDVRMQALNGLLQMNSENAVPILKRVLQKRDACSASLRRKAVFLISQKRSDETENVLLDVAQHDPDGDVRGQAVFWLSQVNTERAVALLDSILRTTTDEELQDKAIFALSQQHSPRAGAALRAYVERTDVRTDSRAKAIFWLGQQRNADNAAYLRGLYAKLTDEDLKEKVIFSLSQMGGAENLRWLMDIALNEREDIEQRKKALFWAGQSHETDLAQLTGLYDRIQSQEMKEQLIFVYSQRHEAAALDKLIDIARREPDRELRKKALFWIGQSHDPRAARFLEEIINQ
jgi:HEAT repeat protein